MSNNQIFLDEPLVKVTHFAKTGAYFAWNLFCLRKICYVKKGVDFSEYFWCKVCSYAYNCTCKICIFARKEELMLFKIKDNDKAEKPVKKATKKSSTDKAAKLTAKIKKGLKEVKLMQEGKLPKKSAFDLVKELENDK